MSVGISNILVGWIIIAVSIPLYLGWVPRNRWYGFRFAKSKESDENWFAINRYGAKSMILWGGVLMALGIVVALFVKEPSRDVQSALGLLPLVVLIPVVQTYLWSRDL